MTEVRVLKAPTRGLTGVLLLALGGLTVISLARPGALVVPNGILFRSVLTTAACVITLGAAYFLLTEFVVHGYVSSLFTGLGFGLVAAANLALGVLPVLAGVESQPPLVSYAWAFQWFITAGLLVAGAFTLRQGFASAGRKRLLLGCLAGEGFLIASLALGIHFAAPLRGDGKVLSALQLGAAFLLFLAAIRYARFSVRGEGWHFYLGLCVLVAAFAQLQFGLQPDRPNVAQLGDLLRMIFYAGIVALLSARWARGYLRLRSQAAELAALHSLMTPPVTQDIGLLVSHIINVIESVFASTARIELSEPMESDVEVDQGVRGLAVSLGGGVDIGLNGVGIGNTLPFERTNTVVAVLGSVNRELGTLRVERVQGDAFTRREYELVQAFARQATTLLERSRLYDEVAAGAVLQERSRLAREIHDGLAQHLAFLKMRVAWLQRTASTIDARGLSDVETVLETALAEARQAISTLRSEPSGTSTADAVCEYARQFGQVSALRVTVDVDSQAPEIPARARVELLRVVQEALNNVRKHAHSSAVRVAVKRWRDGIQVCIEDDGRGFASDQTLDGHFGLDIMAERTESIGGIFDIASTPGSGTRVSIRVPVQPNMNRTDPPASANPHSEPFGSG